MNNGMDSVERSMITRSKQGESCNAKYEVFAGKLEARWRKLMKSDKQKGVSLTELMVALGIFLLFSSVFTASIMQYLRSTSSTAVRAQSASTVMMATQRLERFVTYSNSIGHATGGSDGSTDKNTVLIYSAPSSGNNSSAASAGHGQCIMLQYKPASWSHGSLQDTGVLYYQTADVSNTGVRGEYSVKHALLNSITNDPTATGLSKADLLTVKSADTLQFSPVVGQYSGNKLITSNTQVTFSSRETAASSQTGSTAITYTACQ